jgi:hypothetical protein
MVVSTAHAVYGSHAFLPGFQLFVAQRCTLLKISGFTQISQQSFSTCRGNTLSRWLVRNTPKSSGVCTAKRTMFHAGQLARPPCPIHFSLQVRFRCCLTVWRTWGCAPACLNHMCCHWWRGKCSKSIGRSLKKKDGNLHLLICWVRQLILRVDHMRVHTHFDEKSMLISLCHSGVGIAIHPDMGIMKVCHIGPCESHLNIEKNIRYKLCLQEATGKSPPLHDCWEEWGLALTGCGEVTVHGEFSRQRQHQYVQQLQFFTHTLVLDSSFTLLSAWTFLSEVTSDWGLSWSIACGARDRDLLSCWWGLVYNLWDGILQCG